MKNSQLTSESSSDENNEECTLVDAFAHFCIEGDIEECNDIVEAVVSKQIPPKYESVANEILTTSVEQLDSINENGNSLLHLAAANGHYDVCKLLINKVKVKFMQNKFGNTPLHWAVLNNHERVVELLCNSFSDLSVLTRNNFNRSPLSYAVENDNNKIYELLLLHPSAVELVPEEERHIDAEEMEDFINIAQ